MKMTCYKTSSDLRKYKYILILLKKIQWGSFWTILFGYAVVGTFWSRDSLIAVFVGDQLMLRGSGENNESG